MFRKGLDKNGGRRNTGSRQARRNSALFSCQLQSCTNFRGVLCPFLRAEYASLRSFQIELPKKEVEEMKVKKRLCCLVLVVCLTISLFPVNAFATSGISSQYSDEEIEEIMSQCPYTVTGGSYGESYVYDVTSQKLTLYSGTLSVSIGANATVNLVLAGENMFCRGWDDIHDYSVYLDNNAKVTVSGNGSLICERNYGYPKLYLSDTAEFIIKSGSVQFKGGQNPNSNRNPHTVGGSGKLVVDGGTVLVADELRGKVFSDNPSIELKNGELQFNYDGEFGNCRLKMDGGILKLRQDKEFSFTNLQYNAGTFDVTKAIRFNGQTTINSSLIIPENATFIIPSGQTMIFANGTKLTVSSGGTLQNDGVIKYFCQDTSIPAAASGNGTTEASHIYDQKVVNDKYLKTPATCINVAVYYMSCVCGEKGTETFENGDALGHSWGSWQSNGDDTHTRTCSVCGDTESQNCFGGEATCIDKAVCEVCGDEYGEVNAARHTNLVKAEAKPATHMTEGNTEYWYCDGCDKYFSDEAGTKEIALANTVIPKLTEHTADGTGWHSNETSHWNTCECGEKLKEAAHTFEWVIDKEATATEKGSKHEKCTVCGYEEAAVEIPATGTTDSSEPPTDTDKPSGDQTGDTTSPQTGDDSNIALWMALMLAAGAVLTGTAVYSRKRKYSR